MRVSDAKPGDVLRDRDGARWEVAADGIRCLDMPKGIESDVWYPEDHKMMDDVYGPFRLAFSLDRSKSC